LLTIRGAEVTALLERTGEYAGLDHRDRLFGVLERTHRLLDARHRWREASDPILSDAERRTVGRLLLATALSCADGRWGDEVRQQAAIVVDDLTSESLGWGIEDVPSILGALLITIERLDRVPYGAGYAGR
jgi:hypothetical protein